MAIPVLLPDFEIDMRIASIIFKYEHHLMVGSKNLNGVTKEE